MTNAVAMKNNEFMTSFYNMFVSLSVVEENKRRINQIRKDLRRMKKQMDRIADTKYMEEKYVDRIPIKGDKIRVKEIYKIWDHKYTKQWMADQTGEIINSNQKTVKVKFDNFVFADDESPYIAYVNIEDVYIFQ